MPKLKTVYYFNELKHVIAENDMIKGTILLNNFDKLDAKGQNQFIALLGSSEGEIVISMLGKLLLDEKEFAVPKPVIRNMLLSQAIKTPDKLLSLLTSPDIAQKDVFIELAGEIQLEASVAVIVEILGSSEDVSLMKTCLLALGNIANPAPTNTLSDFLYSGHRELVIAAISALSNIDTPTSVKRLVDRMGTDSDLDLLIIEYKHFF